MMNFNSDEELLRKYFEDQEYQKQQLEAAQSIADQERAIARLGEAGDQLGYSIAGVPEKHDPSFFRDKLKYADSGVDKLKEAQKQGSESRKFLLDHFKNKQEQQARAEEKETQRKFQEGENEKNRQTSRENANAMAALRKETQDAIAEQRNETNVQHLSDKLANSQGLSNALNDFEKALGFKLEEASVQDGKLMVNGEEKDLPGVSLPFIGRTSFYSGGARDLATKVAKVFNVELKDRSGATVTDQEMDRIRQEFGAGKFNTEAELIEAVRSYKAAVAQALKNREAGFSPKAVKTYEERGGQTSKAFASKIMVSNGKEKHLIDPADLADAEKDGFKRIQ